MWSTKLTPIFFILRPLLFVKGVNYYYIKTVKYFPLYIMRQLAHAYHEFFRVNPKNKGSTPLHASAWIGNEVVVKHILNKMDGRKMSYNPKDSTEWTPLHWAAFNGHDSICGMIMAKVKRKNPQNKLGTTPLHYACLNGHIEVCRLMVGMLEDKNPQNMFGDTPLHQAAKAGHFEICKYVFRASTLDLFT